MTPREQFLSDVIVTAIEGGIGYWAVCLQYQWEGNVVVTDHRQHGGGTLAIISPTDTGSIYTITPNTIAHGIAVLQADSTVCAASLRDKILAASRENDAGEIDSEAADVIVQAGLFGEVVYG